MIPAFFVFIAAVDAILEGVKRTEANYPEILKISFVVNGNVKASYDDI